MSDKNLALTVAPRISTIEDSQPLHNLEYHADGGIQIAEVTRRDQRRAIAKELTRQLRSLAESETLATWVVDGLIGESEIPENGQTIPLRLRTLVSLRRRGKLPMPKASK